MKLLLSILLVISVYTTSAQDTIYVSSKTDIRLISYQDSLLAYDTGKDVCFKLAQLFESFTNSKDYTSYFIDAWINQFNPGDPVDTLLGHTEFLLNFSTKPNSETNQFDMIGDIGKQIDSEIARLDLLTVLPYGIVSGAEMPDIYIYRKPCNIVLYRALNAPFNKSRCYTTIDKQTYFILDSKGMSRIPYNILRTYNGLNRLIQVDFVSPTDRTSIIQTIK